MSYETFAQRLASAMAGQGMKQVDLVRAAAGCGVKLGKSHISQYVSGKTVKRSRVRTSCIFWLKHFTSKNPGLETAGPRQHRVRSVQIQAELLIMK